MMVKKLYQLFLLFLISVNVYSQTNYTLNGYIKSASDGESLIGATIYINEIKSIYNYNDSYIYYDIYNGNYNIIYNVNI